MKVKQILKKYFDKNIVKVEKLTGGFRNQCFKVATSENEKFVFIVYKSEEGIGRLIKSAHKVAKFLANKGFPTRVPKVDKNGLEYIQIEFQGGKQFAALYNFLHGSTIPWEAYTRRHLKSIGKTLSDMHYYLREADFKKSLPNWYEQTQKEIKQMNNYFKKVEPWIEKKLEVKLNWEKIGNLSALSSQLLATRSLESVLHYDFLRGNILFSEKIDRKWDTYPIVGILDFEKVCWGPVVADIARTLAFLLVDVKYKKNKKIRKRFFISGYKRRGKNDLPEVVDSAIFENLLAFYWLRDFWKFCENNPYEYLHMNEHYGRTKELLVGEGILHHF